MLVAVLAAYLGVLQYPHVFSHQAHWQRVGVLDSVVPFADMASLTSAWECTRKGQPVMEVNRCDPVAWRPANYPHVWMRLSGLGLGQGDATPLGLALDGLFLLSIFLLAGRLTVGEGLVWGALVVSPSVMLGVDRANVDYFLFVLVVVALALLARRRVRWRVAGCALIELAAVLKLFPIFAAAALLQWRRRRAALVAFASVALVFVAYAYSIRHELETIRRVVPRSIELSYGAGVIDGALRRTYGTDVFLAGHRLVTVALIGLGSLLVAAVAALLLERSPRAADPEPSTRLPWLWAGAGIFVGTWLLTEDSFDYRLAFCLLAVPQLLEWARQRRPAVPFARVALGLLVATLWLSDTTPFSSGITKPWLRLESHFPFDEILVWLLVVYLTTAAIRTRPAWLAERVGAADELVPAPGR